MGGEDQRRDRSVGSDLDRAQLLGHREVLVQGEHSDRDHRDREDQPAGDGDRDREGDPGDRDEDPLGGLATQPPAALRRSRCRLGSLLDSRIIEAVEELFGLAEAAARPAAALLPFLAGRAPCSGPRPEAPLPRLVLLQGGLERLPREVRPELIAGRRAPSRRTARAGSWRSRCSPLVLIRRSGSCISGA